MKLPEGSNVYTIFSCLTVKTMSQAYYYYYIYTTRSYFNGSPDTHPEAILDRVLIGLNFPSHITNLIMQCVSSVSYSTVVNGELGPFFSPEHSLRQGDPLSPYLFIIYVEIFSCILEKAQDDRVIHGIKVGRQSPHISHLFFADDFVIFSRTSLQEDENVLQCIQT